MGISRQGMPRGEPIHGVGDKKFLTAPSVHFPPLPDRRTILLIFGNSYVNILLRRNPCDSPVCSPFCWSLDFPFLSVYRPLPTAPPPSKPSAPCATGPMAKARSAPSSRAPASAP